MSPRIKRMRAYTRIDGPARADQVSGRYYQVEVPDSAHVVRRAGAPIARAGPLGGARNNTERRREVWLFAAG